MIEFDPGPPSAFAELFAQAPDYAPYKEHFWYDWGPVFYRGRLDDSARVLCIASDPGPTERIALRVLVGETGKYADLLVVARDSGDPYATLLQAQETDISLVIINGVPRFGDTALMEHFGPGTERWQVGQTTRVLNLAGDASIPAMKNLSLRDASDRLRDGLQQLPKLASDLEQPTIRALPEAQPPQWFLRLDEPNLEGLTLRPFLDQGMPGLEAIRDQLRALATVPLSQVLVPLDLIPLCVADDTTFFDHLQKQVNLPGYMKQSLPTLY